MDSLLKYGSDEETEYTDKTRDHEGSPSSSSSSQRRHKNSSNYGNIGSSSSGGNYKRTATTTNQTDDTNYESVQMDMSEDSTYSQDSPIVGEDRRHDFHNKKRDNLQANKSMNKHNSSTSHSSKQDNRDKKDKNGKGDRDRNRERIGRDNDRKEFRNDRDKISNSRKSRDDKEERRDHRDGKDRLEKEENKRENKEKEREKEKERDRDKEKEKIKDSERKSATIDEHRRKSNSNDRKEKRRSKSKSRSRSRERERNAYRPAGGPSNALLNRIDRRKEKVQQLEKMGIDYSNSANKTGIELPGYYNPGAVNPVKYADQVQKRKLLWGHKKNEQEQAAKWESAKFAADSDGKVASKFMRLMGIKDAPPKSTGESSSGNVVGPDLVKKQEELFSTMEQQYEVARQVTHTMRGVGLGFGSQPRPF